MNRDCRILGVIFQACNAQDDTTISFIAQEVPCKHVNSSGAVAKLQKPFFFNELEFQPEGVLNNTSNHCLASVDCNRHIICLFTSNVQLVFDLPCAVVLSFPVPTSQHDN